MLPSAIFQKQSKGAYTLSNLVLNSKLIPKDWGTAFLEDPRFTKKSLLRSTVNDPDFAKLLALSPRCPSSLQLKFYKDRLSALPRPNMDYWNSDILFSLIKNPSLCEPLKNLMVKNTKSNSEFYWWLMAWLLDYHQLSSEQLDIIVARYNKEKNSPGRNLLKSLCAQKNLPPAFLTQRRLSTIPEACKNPLLKGGRLDFFLEKALKEKDTSSGKSLIYGLVQNPNLAGVQFERILSALGSHSILLTDLARNPALPTKFRESLLKSGGVSLYSNRKLLASREDIGESFLETLLKDTDTQVRAAALANPKCSLPLLEKRLLKSSLTNPGPLTLLEAKAILANPNSKNTILLLRWFSCIPLSEHASLLSELAKTPFIPDKVINNVINSEENKSNLVPFCFRPFLSTKSKKLLQKVLPRDSLLAWFNHQDETFSYSDFYKADILDKTPVLPYGATSPPSRFLPAYNILTIFLDVKQAPWQPCHNPKLKALVETFPLQKIGGTSYHGNIPEGNELALDHLFYKDAINPTWYVLHEDKVGKFGCSTVKLPFFIDGWVSLYRNKPPEDSPSTIVSPTHFAGGCLSFADGRIHIWTLPLEKTVSFPSHLNIKNSYPPLRTPKMGQLFANIILGGGLFALWSFEGGPFAWTLESTLDSIPKTKIINPQDSVSLKKLNPEKLLKALIAQQIKL